MYFISFLFFYLFGFVLVLLFIFVCLVMTNPMTILQEIKSGWVFEPNVHSPFIKYGLKLILQFLKFKGPYSVHFAYQNVLKSILLFSPRLEPRLLRSNYQLPLFTPRSYLRTQHFLVQTDHLGPSSLTYPFS